MIFIIIVNYNSQRFVQQCLESLKLQTFKHFKLMVVDNNSKDKSLTIVKKIFPQAKIIKNKTNLGFPAAANQGSRWALKNGADSVVFLGFDTKLDKNWLKELVLADGDIIQSKILLADGRVQSLGNKIHFLGFGYPYSKPQKNLDYASGTSMLVKKEVFQKIGFFDERIMFLEDLDFGWRARRAGFKIKLSQKSFLYHNYDFHRYAKKFYFIERARKLVLLKNLSFGQFLLRLLFEPFIFAYSLLTGWFKDKIRAEIYFLKNLK